MSQRYSSDLPDTLTPIEKKHLLGVLEECRKPGDTLLERLECYLLPTSLIKREVRYQFLEMI